MLLIYAKVLWKTFTPSSRASNSMNVAPFEEDFKTGTFRLMFKAKESAAKEGASLSSQYRKIFKFLN